MVGVVMCCWAGVFIIIRSSFAALVSLMGTPEEEIALMDKVGYSCKCGVSLMAAPAGLDAGICDAFGGLLWMSGAEGLLFGLRRVCGVTFSHL